MQAVLGPQLEFARGLLVEARQHQTFVAILLGLGLGSRIQNEPRDLAKVLRLLLFHGIPRPLAARVTYRRVTEKAIWQGRAVEAAPLYRRFSVGAELAADIVGMALGPALEELAELRIRRLRQDDPKLHILVAEPLA